MAYRGGWAVILDICTLFMHTSGTRYHWVDSAVSASRFAWNVKYEAGD